PTKSLWRAGQKVPRTTRNRSKPVSKSLCLSQASDRGCRWVRRGRLLDANALCNHGLSIGLRRLAGEYFSKTISEVFQSLGRIASALLGHRPARIAHVVQRFHHCRPIVIAFEQRDIKAFPQALFVTSFAAELFNVELLNSLAENAHPLLRPA